MFVLIKKAAEQCQGSRETTNSL